MNLPKIPLGDWVESLEGWLETNAEPFFNGVKWVIGGIVEGLEFLFTLLPAPIVIVLFALIAYFVGKLRISLFTLIGLGLVWNLGYWEETMQTLALVLTSALISIIVG